jgi:2'-5' RNA ligase
MRLFTAIDLPQDVAERLARVLAQWKPLAPIRWARVENLHITTKFIGEWPQARLEELKTKLGLLSSRDRFTIGINGLSWFPNPHHPRIFHASIRAPAALEELARETDELLVQIGASKEDNPYRPHLTLARTQPPCDLGPLRRAVAGLPSADFGAFQLGAFHLYLSQTASGGSKYTKLASYPLQR